MPLLIPIVGVGIFLAGIAVGVDATIEKAKEMEPEFGEKLEEERAEIIVKAVVDKIPRNVYRY